MKFPRIRHPAKALTRREIAPVLAYAAAFAGLLGVAGLALLSLRDGYADYRSAAETLVEIEGRKPFGNGASSVARAPQTPFLEGPSLTVAGAELQQRVAAAVRAAGGNVLSSQVELQKAEATPGFVRLTASCEVDQDKLQELLYDLEAGMPFLFVDQIEAQTPQAGDGPGGRQNGPLRVEIGVSGQWRLPGGTAAP